MRNVFVYGSLLSGLHNSVLLNRGGARLVAEYVTEPAYTLVSLGSYPAVLETGTTPVRGELWEVSDSVWRDIERLEGYPVYYGAKTLETPYGAARMYTLPAEGYSDYTPILSGDWRAFVEAKDASFLYSSRPYN